jgi:dTDP-glucose 4,6-dehydratase
MNKYLVIGSNSFSGSHFVNALLDKGFETFAISRSPHLENVFCPYTWESNKKKPVFYQLDINKNNSEIIALIKKHKINNIINFAAQSMVAQSWDNPEDWYQTNVIGQVALLNHLKGFDFIEKYIHITTPEVYGSTDGWIKENYSYNPTTPYAISRATLDMHLKALHEVYKFPVIFTRAANVYGPGQPLYRIIPRALFLARTGNKLSLDGGGKSIRSFIHIEDVVLATFKIMLDGKIGSCYHISTNDLITIKDLVIKISELTNINFNKLVQMSPERMGKDTAYMLDSTFLRSDLNWKPKIDLDRGLADTLKWIDRNFQKLKKQPKNYEHKK